MPNWLTKLFMPAAPAVPERSHAIRARWDAAQTTDENRRHWANADLFSADAAASSQVRQTLRARSRYEVANNSFARGIVTTLANDCIGTGPRLQILSDDPNANAEVEREFMAWFVATGMAEKLRTMRMSKCESGEVFGLIIDNPDLQSRVTLDLRVIESDQIDDSPGFTGPSNAGGINFDRIGNPTNYIMLKRHPGDTGVMSGLGMSIGGFSMVSAANMIHYFRPDRPGQHRGIPELTPALPLFAMLRRYRLACLNAAETAANLSLILKTNAPANGEAADLDPMDVFELARNMGMVAPEGWEPYQMKSEHPTTNHVEFIQSVLAEISRCLNMPYGIAAGDHSRYNYASGQLDREGYDRSVVVERSVISSMILDRLLKLWFDEAALIEGYMPAIFRQRDVLKRVRHQWLFEGRQHADPVKAANAIEVNLKNNVTTLADEWARKGKDWEERLRQRAREIALQRELGLGDQPSPTSPAAQPAEEDLEEVGSEQ